MELVERFVGGTEGDAFFQTECGGWFGEAGGRRDRMDGRKRRRGAEPLRWTYSDDPSARKRLSPTAAISGGSDHGSSRLIKIRLLELESAVVMVQMPAVEQPDAARFRRCRRRGFGAARRAEEAQRKIAGRTRRSSGSSLDAVTMRLKQDEQFGNGGQTARPDFNSTRFGNPRSISVAPSHPLRRMNTAFPTSPRTEGEVSVCSSSRTTRPRGRQL